MLIKAQELFKKSLVERKKSNEQITNFLTD